MKTAKFRWKSKQKLLAQSARFFEFLWPKRTLLVLICFIRRKKEQKSRKFYSAKINRHDIGFNETCIMVCSFYPAWMEVKNFTEKNFHFKRFENFNSSEWKNLQRI